MIMRERDFGRGPNYKGIQHFSEWHFSEKPRGVSCGRAAARPRGAYRARAREASEPPRTRAPQTLFHRLFNCTPRMLFDRERSFSAALALSTAAILVTRELARQARRAKQSRVWQSTRRELRVRACSRSLQRRSMTRSTRTRRATDRILLTWVLL
jgi:hypothetical protein